MFTVRMAIKSHVADQVSEVEAAIDTCIADRDRVHARGLALALD